MLIVPSPGGSREIPVKSELHAKGERLVLAPRTRRRNLRFPLSRMASVEIAAGPVNRFIMPSHAPTSFGPEAQRGDASIFERPNASPASYSQREMWHC